MEVAPSVDILEILGVRIVIPSMNMEFEDVQDLPKVFNFLIALPWSSLFLLEILPAVCHLGPQNRSYPPFNRRPKLPIGQL
jgi:hypothetical protein